MENSSSSKLTRRKEARQNRFLTALRENGGRIGDAAESAGISRQTHHNWYRNCSGYRERFDRIAEGEQQPSVKKRGRPTKYSAEVVEAICSAISEGVPFTHAAAIGGISYQSFLDWQARFPEFLESIERAKAEGIQARLRLILSSAERGDISSARWWLEHAASEHFAKNRVDHQHRLEGNVQHSFAVPEEVLNSIAEARRRHDGD